MADKPIAFDSVVAEMTSGRALTVSKSEKWYKKTPLLFVAHRSRNTQSYLAGYKQKGIITPFGRGTYSPDENLMTFELRVQKNSQDWGYGGYSIYKERQPAVISYIFQVYRG